MRVGIIGASSAGIYAALLLKKRHPDYEVVVFDQADKAGKKLLATGNGHCNLLHDPLDPSCYNHPDFVGALLQKHPLSELFGALDELGIEIMNKDGLIYPLSYSAAAHTNYLISSLLRLGVDLRLNERVIDINDGDVITNKRHHFDHLIFAFGGMSQKNLGSDGSLFGVLQKLGYKVTPLRPSLCPIETPDVGKSLFGVRHAARVRLMRKGEIVYEESGEVQFKKDAVSGIAVMNASSYFVPGDYLSINLFEQIPEEELKRSLAASYARSKEDFLKPFLEYALAQFTMKQCSILSKKELNSADFSKIAHFLTHFELRLTKLFDFDSSQVTRGGIDLSEVDDRLCSKRNGKHHFVGECLDVDGLCGGYNLGFALLSALEVAESL